MSRKSLFSNIFLTNEKINVHKGNYFLGKEFYQVNLLYLTIAAFLSNTISCSITYKSCAQMWPRSLFRPTAMKYC